MASRATNGKGPGALYRWGAYAVRNRWKVLGGWIAFLIVFAGIAFTLKGDFNDHFSIPGADSQKAFDLLEERFPEDCRAPRRRRGRRLRVRRVPACPLAQDRLHEPARAGQQRDPSVLLEHAEGSTTVASTVGDRAKV